jgi:hypothetical protein
MIQTMQFTYGHLVTIYFIYIYIYNIFTTKYISQNVHSKFYKKKRIATNIIHCYNNDFVHPTQFFMIDKTTTIVVDE